MSIDMKELENKTNKGFVGHVESFLKSDGDDIRIVELPNFLEVYIVQRYSTGRFRSFTRLVFDYDDGSYKSSGIFTPEDVEMLRDMGAFE